MHKSRLCAMVIDCKDADPDEAARFWGAALGKPVKPTSPDDGDYRGIGDSNDPVMVLVQKVPHESRVHIDIESDDVEAEVARLEALGARRLEKVRTWWVMEAPTGQRFCVVRPQRGPLDGANEWP
ncbi:MAG TPA: VOC family protein [Kofleriaceae bacterium]|nr:VOC family protein [Kofleriaceae bacterium]